MSSAAIKLLHADPDAAARLFGQALHDEYATLFGLEVEPVAPTLQHIQIDPDGTFNFIFAEAVTATDATGLTVTASGGASTLTYSSGSGSRRLRFTASRAPAPTETITVAGVNVGIASSSGSVALEDFADVPAKAYLTVMAGNMMHAEETVLNPAWNPTVRSIANGAANADAATVWDTGTVPTATDRVLITHTVTNDGTLEAAGILVYTGGTLAFDPTVDTELIVNTIVVAGTGVWQQGTSAARIDSTKTATVTFRDSALPDQQLDPAQRHNGLLILGDATFRAYGAVMTVEAPDLVLAVEPLVGHTTLTLASPPSGWKIGYRVVIPDTRPFNFGEGEQLEVRTITGITGAVIDLDSPLEYDHLGGRDRSGNLDVLPHITILERNVILRSANSVGNRGHTLFAGRATIDCEYVYAKNLGRTTNQSPIPSATPNTITDDSVVTDGITTYYGTNQKGIYPFHFHHHIGPANPGNTGYQSYFRYWSVEDGKKWGMAFHRSHYHDVTGGSVYNCNHAGIAFETGNESYSLIDKCTIIGVVNDGSFTIGDGIWGLAPGFNIITNCFIATVCQGNNYTPERGEPYLGHCIHMTDGPQRGGARASGNNPERYPLLRGVDIDADAAVENTDYELLPHTQTPATVTGNKAMGSTKFFSKDHFGSLLVQWSISDNVACGMGKEAVFDYGGDSNLIITNQKVRRWSQFALNTNNLLPNSFQQINNPDIQQYEEFVFSNTSGWSWHGTAANPGVVRINGGTIAAYYPVIVNFSPQGQNPGPPTATVPAKTQVFNGVTMIPVLGSSIEVKMDTLETLGTPTDPCSWEQAFLFNRNGTGENYQLFYDQQDPTAECLTGSGYGATVGGRTNAVEFADSGRCNVGELMPASAATQSWLTGGKAAVFLSGEVDVDGVTVTLTATAEIDTDGTGWSVTGSTTGAVGLTYVSGTGTKTLVFTAASTLVTGETVTGAYDADTGNAETTAAGVVLPDLVFPVTNNSEQAGGGFSPDDIAGLQFWAESDTGVYEDAGTDPAEDTDTVAQWNDQSANADHAVQASAGSRLQYRTGIINSLPVIRGDGNLKFLSAPLSGATAYTVYFVVIPTNLDGDRFLADWRNSGDGNPILVNAYFDSAGRIRHRTRNDAGSLVEVNTGVGEAVLNTPIIVRASWDGSTISVRANNGSAVTGAFSGTTTVDEFNFPSDSSGYQIDYAAILVYNSDVTGDDDTDVMTYLNDKYSVF